MSTSSLGVVGCDGQSSRSSVCTLQDELFNLTTDEIRTTAIRSQLDMHVSVQYRAC